ncbi:hypothetical protein CGL56_03710 [Neolewinella marina]|uniref:Lipoprotein n=1 Tax=Neolewinella marina TaxID=438751 RepID=A0A2G0CJK6_9BACT|nr:hypothetical protein CGL56_03710 [Neolewinella marina]
MLRRCAPALILLLCLTACDEEALNDALSPDLVAQQEELSVEVLSTLPPDEDTTQTPPDQRPEPCLRFVFPVSFELPNNSIVTVEDQQQLRDFVRRVEPRRRAVSFVYPFEMTTIDGQVIEIQNFRDFRQARRSCGAEFGRYGWRERVQAFRACFQLVFPVSVTVNDEVIDVENARDLCRVFRRRGDDTRAYLNYPIEVVVKESGDTVEVADRDALQELRRECTGGN